MNIDDLITKPNGTKQLGEPTIGGVYDAEIKPLVERIAEICQEHGIAGIMDFVMATPDTDGKTVSIMSMGPGEHGYPIRHLAARGILSPSKADNSTRAALADVLTADLKNLPKAGD